MTIKIIHGDCLEVLPTVAADSIDAIVTDPPYGLEFMGKEWDGADGFRRSLNTADVGRDNVFGRTSARGPEYRVSGLFQSWCQSWASELLRVLKPGAHLVAFGGCRTYHRMACAVEDAGFEIRDQIQWIYGQGFPKSHHVLKPAHEPIVLARKPLVGTITATVEKYGTGSLNIKACHVAINPDVDDPRLGGRGDWSTDKMAKSCYGAFAGQRQSSSKLGRWPANVIHDGSDEVLAEFPETQSGTLTPDMNIKPSSGWSGGSYADRVKSEFHANKGSAARFFYHAKANKADRAGSKHPTCKPIDLIAYLCRLVTPPRGVVLDPFAGSGTTATACQRENFDCVLIEREAEYIADIHRRVAGLTADPPGSPVPG